MRRTAEASRGEKRGEERGMEKTETPTGRAPGGEEGTHDARGAGWSAKRRSATARASGMRAFEPGARGWGAPGGGDASSPPPDRTAKENRRVSPFREEKEERSGRCTTKFYTILNCNSTLFETDVVRLALTRPSPWRRARARRSSAAAETRCRFAPLSPRARRRPRSPPQRGPTARPGPPGSPGIPPPPRAPRARAATARRTRARSRRPPRRTPRPFSSTGTAAFDVPEPRRARRRRRRVPDAERDDARERREGRGDTTLPRPPPAPPPRLGREPQRERDADEEGEVAEQDGPPRASAKPGSRWSAKLLARASNAAPTRTTRHARFGHPSSAAAAAAALAPQRRHSDLGVREPGDLRGGEERERVRAREGENPAREGPGRAPPSPRREAWGANAATASAWYSLRRKSVRGAPGRRATRLTAESPPRGRRTRTRRGDGRTRRLRGPGGRSTRRVRERREAPRVRERGGEREHHRRGGEGAPRGRAGGGDARAEAVRPREAARGVGVGVGRRLAPDEARAATRSAHARTTHATIIARARSRASGKARASSEGGRPRRGEVELARGPRGGERDGEGDPLAAIASARVSAPGTAGGIHAASATASRAWSASAAARASVDARSRSGGRRPAAAATLAASAAAASAGRANFAAPASSAPSTPRSRRSRRRRTATARPGGPARRTSRGARARRGGRRPGRPPSPRGGGATSARLPPERRDAERRERPRLRARPPARRLATASAS